jgi:hypothetical protein
MPFAVQMKDRRRRVGRIDIGGFSEHFQVSGQWPLAKFESEWTRQLRGLLGRKKKAMLPTAASGTDVFRAWILYRDSKRLYVQERYFFRRPFRLGRSRIATREVRSEEGRKISEWSLPIEALAEFVSKMPNQSVSQRRGADAPRRG